jgi:hypothetical protein
VDRSPPGSVSTSGGPVYRLLEPSRAAVPRDQETTRASSELAWGYWERVTVLKYSIPLLAPTKP